MPYRQKSTSTETQTLIFYLTCTGKAYNLTTPRWKGQDTKVRPPHNYVTVWYPGIRAGFSGGVKHFREEKGQWQAMLY